MVITKEIKWHRTADELPAPFVDVIMSVPKHGVCNGFLQGQGNYFTADIDSIHEYAYRVDEIKWWAFPPEAPEEEV